MATFHRMNQHLSREKRRCSICSWMTTSTQLWQLNPLKIKPKWRRTMTKCFGSKELWEYILKVSYIVLLQLRCVKVYF